MVDKNRLIENFKKYVAVNTQSDPDSQSSPSTPGQIELAKIMAEDLKKAGASDVELQDDAFIFATIPASSGMENKPVIGLLAHLDTANEAPGENVKIRMIENYQGGEINYPANPSVKLDYESAPKLKECIGHTVITSDGTTLLGGDDKAGLAVLTELVHYYKKNPDKPHGKVRIAVIPDEETGVGTEKLDLNKFGVDFAYTLDGGEIGEIDIESFNGFMGKISIEGNAAFPGYGKGIYLNAIQVLSKFIAKMDDDKWPQNAEGRDPIWWIQKMDGDVSHAEAAVYLRDFDLEGIEKQKELLNSVKESINKEFPKAKISLDISETYKNYKYELKKDSRVVDYAKEAMKKIDIEPKENFVRGGNDSCHLCFSGLLSTNIFVGMQNMHSLIEWNTVESIEASARTVISLLEVWASK